MDQLGNGAFLGADAIEVFLDIGAGLTVIVEAALDDAGCACCMEDDAAAVEACGAGGGLSCCICWIHAGWTLRSRVSSPVMPAIHDWTFSCSSMILPRTLELNLVPIGPCISTIGLCHGAQKWRMTACAKGTSMPCIWIMRSADDCSCHSMHNTIEDPWLCVDPNRRSSRSISCTAAAAPSQDVQPSGLGILPLHYPDRDSQSWY